MRMRDVIHLGLMGALLSQPAPMIEVATAPAERNTRYRGRGKSRRGAKSVAVAKRRRMNKIARVSRKLNGRAR